jgi:hypothetical protein
VYDQAPPLARDGGLHGLPVLNLHGLPVLNLHDLLVLPDLKLHGLLGLSILNLHAGVATGGLAGRHSGPRPPRRHMVDKEAAVPYLSRATIRDLIAFILLFKDWISFIFSMEGSYSFLYFNSSPCCNNISLFKEVTKSNYMQPTKHTLSSTYLNTHRPPNI